MLLQAVFEKIWIVDEQVVGVDLARPFTEVLTVEAQLDLRSALNGTDQASVSYERPHDHHGFWSAVGFVTYAAQSHRRGLARRAGTESPWPVSCAPVAP